jgi:hypothetical protein
MKSATAASTTAESNCQFGRCESRPILCPPRAKASATDPLKCTLKPGVFPRRIAIGGLGSQGDPATKTGAGVEEVDDLERANTLPTRITQRPRGRLPSSCWRGADWPKHWGRYVLRLDLVVARRSASSCSVLTVRTPGPRSGGISMAAPRVSTSASTAPPWTPTARPRRLPGSVRLRLQRDG